MSPSSTEIQFLTARWPIGRVIDDLLLVAVCYAPEEIKDQVFVLFPFNRIVIQNDSSSSRPFFTTLPGTCGAVFTRRDKKLTALFENRAPIRQNRRRFSKDQLGVWVGMM